MKTQKPESNEPKKEALKQELPIEKEIIQNVSLPIDLWEEADDLEEEESLTSFQQITNGDFKRLMGCGG